MRVSEYGVHRTHCCRKHGCKYRDEDCPVENGIIDQLYPCQDDRPDNPCFGDNPELMTKNQIKQIITDAFNAGREHDKIDGDFDWRLEDYLKEKGYE